MIYTLTLNPSLDKQYLVGQINLGDVLQADQVQLDAGGKGINVSRMLSNLGESSRAICLLGGPNGKVIHQELSRQGIEVIEIAIGGETRSNISVVSKINHQYLKINEPGPKIEQSEIAALLEVIDRTAASGDFWVLSGSMPTGAPLNLYYQIAMRVQQHGGMIILDTSGPALRETLKASPMLVKPNLKELSEVLGRPIKFSEIVENPRMFHEKLGAQIMLISAGKEGAVICDGKQSYACVPPSIDEFNPIGAGDAMAAGLAWSLKQGKDLEATLKWGVACGTAKAMQSGTTMPRLRSVEDIFRALISV